jgi:hypothetical protein
MTCQLCLDSRKVWLPVYDETIDLGIPIDYQRHRVEAHHCPRCTKAIEPQIHDVHCVANEARFDYRDEYGLARGTQIQERAMRHVAESIAQELIKQRFFHIEITERPEDMTKRMVAKLYVMQPEPGRYHHQMQELQLRNAAMRASPTYCIDPSGPVTPIRTASEIIGAYEAMQSRHDLNRYGDAADALRFIMPKPKGKKPK